MCNKLVLKFFLVIAVAIAAPQSRADFAAGFDAFSVGDYAKALAEWTPLAEQGQADSEFGLGLLNANGWGVPQDDAQALHWYELAANQGHGEAAYNISVMYQNGWGVEQSDAEALKWIRMSADNGFATAHRDLGGLYKSGIGVSQDYVQAYQWYETGAALGDQQSGFNREELETSLDAAQIATAKEAAKAWLEQFRASHPDYAWPDAQE
jgi:TPR repeat protein